MKAATIQEIKEDLKERPAAELVQLCLRLARFKKENKELLTYLLFEEVDEEGYVQQVRVELDEGFAQVNIRQLHLAKKTLRKLLRIANKYIRYSNHKTTEADILLHYCINFKALNLPLHKSATLTNLYRGQLKKIRAAVDTLHEDLQHDYHRTLNRLD
jgi:uncharacterized FlaG/YvyC family protein